MTTPPVLPNPNAGQDDYAECEAEIKALTDRVTALEAKVNGEQDSDDAPQSDNPFSQVKGGY